MNDQQWLAERFEQHGGRLRVVAYRMLGSLADPDVVYRADRGAAAGGSVQVRGAETVAGQAMVFSQRGLLIRPVLINGTPGVVSSRDGRPFSVIGFTVTDGKITEIDVIMDPDRLQQLDLSALGDQRQ